MTYKIMIPCVLLVLLVTVGVIALLQYQGTYTQPGNTDPVPTDYTSPPELPSDDYTSPSEAIGE